MILLLGLPKTGTTSMRRALASKGYRVATDPFNDRMRRAFDAGDYSLSEWTDRYDVFSDLLVARHWRGLLDAHPDARVILTTRTITEWIESIRHHFAHIRAGTVAELWQEMGAGDFTAAELYGLRVEHEGGVLLARPNALIFNCFDGDSWDRLGYYLQWRTVPTGPFPHENRRR